MSLSQLVCYEVIMLDTRYRAEKTRETRDEYICTITNVMLN